MSSDDAIFVQKNTEGKWTFLWGSMSADVPPAPSTAKEEEIFFTLEEGIRTLAEASMETEYGFRFPNLHNFGFRVEDLLKGGKEVSHG